jgi:hypothetical protein
VCKAIDVLLEFLYVATKSKQRVRDVLVLEKVRLPLMQGCVPSLLLSVNITVHTIILIMSRIPI